MALEQALGEIDRACSSGAVVRDRAIREACAIDESEVTPIVPEAVVRVSNTAEAAAVMRAASRHGVPVTPRGGGTGRVGGAVPVEGGLVVAFEGMKGILDVERADLRAIVEPGVVLGDLHASVEAEGLFYPPDPSSLESCTIGGNIACNAGGPRAFKYGVTREWVLGLEVVTGDGSVVELGRPTAKGVTGYDLASLMVGSEGTLGLVTRAMLRLTPKPEGVATLLAFLKGDDALVDVVTALLARRFVPRCLEFLDDLALEIVRPLAGLDVPAGAEGMLLVELDGDLRELDRAGLECGSVMMDAGALDVLVARDGTERERLWKARRGMSRAMRAQAAHKFSEDVVVPRTKIGALLARCRELSEAHGIRMPTYGHAGDGNLHVQFLYAHEDELPQVNAAIRGLFEHTIALGGTLSGEHGIGVLKAPYLGIEQSPALIALQERVKTAFDPAGVLNPGKIFPEAARRFHGAC